VKGSGGAPQDWSSRLDGVDWPVVIRGASLGFTVLIFSGLLEPIVQRFSPAFGLVMLVGGAIAASVAAAWKVGPAESPVLSGVFAALFAYTLSVPLIYFAQHRIDWIDVLKFAALALVVGGLTGFWAGRRHVPEPPPRGSGRRR
jgi:hypothetical protein